MNNCAIDRECRTPPHGDALTTTLRRPTDLETVTLTLCRSCLNGAGGECHTPGCALWMSAAPDIPVKR